MTLDIGGEGRHADAWNLNPSRVKTIGQGRGQPIPRHIHGRGEAIPFPDRSIDCIIVERTPLRRAVLNEIERVIAAHGVVVLRHAVPEGLDPHAMAQTVLPGRITQQRIRIKRQTLQETRFQLDAGDLG